MNELARALTSGSRKQERIINLHSRWLNYLSIKYWLQDWKVFSSTGWISWVQVETAEKQVIDLQVVATETTGSKLSVEQILSTKDNFHE